MLTQSRTAVTRRAGARFQGDCERAGHAAVRRVTAALGAGAIDDWPAAERHAFAALAPLVALIPGEHDDLQGGIRIAAIPE